MIDPVIAHNGNTFIPQVTRTKKPSLPAKILIIDFYHKKRFHGSLCYVPPLITGQYCPLLGGLPHKKDVLKSQMKYIFCWQRANYHVILT